MTDKVPEHIIKLIQKCISLVPVTVLGSGASAAYGIAGMPELAQYLITHIAPAAEDVDKWNGFKVEIESGLDLESALLKVTISEMLEKEIVKKTRELIIQKDAEVLNSIIKNELNMPLSRLFQHLNRTANPHIRVITTNYDRIAEYAIDQAYLKHYSGFEGQYKKIFKGFSPTQLSNGSIIEVLKVHGSLDWFILDDLSAISIPDTCNVMLDLNPLMVTPGLNKYKHTHDEPFRSIISRTDEIFQHSKSILCIGYGFNDNHIQPKLVAKMREGKTPILIITKNLSDKAKTFITSNTQSNILGIEEHNTGSKIICSTGEEIVITSRIWDLNNILNLAI
ncbi:MAG: SIR2 family protein [Syntrophomonas sp.]|nr:SIR2 family protein [Syntrophomonas sp.]